jgi:hypothetical protein
MAASLVTRRFSLFVLVSKQQQASPDSRGPACCGVLVYLLTGDNNSYQGGKEPCLVSLRAGAAIGDLARIERESHCDSFDQR